jgi:trimeric autotransporter adhesin
MSGGAGNDTYQVDVATDVVTEAAGQGVDLVQSGLTWTLGADIENLTLTGSTAIDGTGNALDNSLIGNGAANGLNGGAGNDLLDGGNGNDTMTGGLGDDIYVVNASADVVTETAGQGSDTVRSSVTLTLADNIENLTLTSTFNVWGTGNALGNVLVGNDVNNTLNGGAGADTLDGGLGTDVLIGGSEADAYLFGRGWGVDTVQENDSTLGVVDFVKFNSGIAKADVQFLQVGNNLEVLLRGTADKMIVKDWYRGSAYHVEEFRFTNGDVITDAQVQGLIGAMAAFNPMPATDMGVVAEARSPQWRGCEMAAPLM